MKAFKKQALITRSLALALAAVVAGATAQDTGTIKIGNTGALTGPYNEFGEGTRRGIVLAIDRINAKGGILGRKVELAVSLDDQLIPDRAVQNIRRILDAPEVVVIVGPGGSGPTLAVIDMVTVDGRASVLSRSVDAAAKSAFYDLGISRTQRRQGILVFASLFEGRARLLPDVAVNAATLAQIEARLSARLKARDFSGFIAEVEGMAPVLAATMPRGESDENELPDEMQ